LCPLYLKNHSHGEYVFDWAWADAYERAGGRYYPKLISAVPFTPITGPRLLVSNQEETEKIVTALTQGMIELASKYGVATIHVNFLPDSQQKQLEHLQFLSRNDIQFHWQNHHYKDFEDFLNSLVSRKRRSIRKERKKIGEYGLRMHRFHGEEISPTHWDAFYEFYKNTYDRKWGAPYLNREFFDHMHQTMRDKVMLVIAYDSSNTPIAGALNLVGKNRLYGRNWGCLDQYKFLHFETCYYQAIEFAIENKLEYVEAGTQGQHKLQRGYLPTKTCSSHYIADPGLKAAIDRYLISERKQIIDGISILLEQGPFKE
ncbi:MAG: GNAT family N-acetyltransferase, partial [Alphaproteobacteria bacterium]|nr:GNAT family N-acetyltransferase [Alphaproteobacteria bacterium]